MSLTSRRNRIAAASAIMDQGHEVGRLARQLFAGGVEVKSGDPEQAIRITRDLIANPEVPAIFEATFENGGVLVRADILQRRRDNRWRLLEIKSATSLKEEHLDDRRNSIPRRFPVGAGLGVGQFGACQSRLCVRRRLD